jgi:Protein of unknown function (DUF2490)
MSSEKIWKCAGVSSKLTIVAQRFVQQTRTLIFAGFAMTGRRRIVRALLVLCVLALAVPAKSQQQPEDPEDDKQFGLWLDQTISAGLSPDKSLEFEIHERFDKGGTNLYEYFAQGGPAFRPRPWFMVVPIYRYQRYPGNETTSYENRVQLNLTLTRPRGAWRPNLRTLIEGRFPENREASARLRFRPGVEYTLPLHNAWRPVLVVNNELFIVPGPNSFANGGFYTQNRFQIGARLPVTNAVSVRPYFMLQSVSLPEGWDTNDIFGISLGLKILNKSK